MMIDTPPCAPEADIVAAWAVALVAAYLVAVLVPWVKVYRALDAVEIPLPRIPSAVGGLRRVIRSIRRAVSSFRSVIDPEAEFHRGLRDYCASLPPRSGLTRREELLKECATLPAGALRSQIRAQILAYESESPAAVMRARMNAGRPVVERLSLEAN